MTLDFQKKINSDWNKKGAKKENNGAKRFMNFGKES